MEMMNSRLEKTNNRETEQISSSQSLTPTFTFCRLGLLHNKHLRLVNIFSV
uniref:Uncharacterized protein n=1 Tax=Anguilla anguilla TaxID=7936 RepID=A0A0E9V7S2_ANGAN